MKNNKGKRWKNQKGKTNKYKKKKFNEIKIRKKQRGHQRKRKNNKVYACVHVCAGEQLNPSQLIIISCALDMSILPGHLAFNRSEVSLETVSGFGSATAMSVAALLANRHQTTGTC